MRLARRIAQLVPVTDRTDDAEASEQQAYDVVPFYEQFLDKGVHDRLS